MDKKLPDNAAEDSVSMIPLFQDTEKVIRDHVVHHSIRGKFAIRDRQWKLVLCPGSGGWSKDDAEAVKEGLPLVQLYDMESDPGEKNNLYNKYPEKVKEMVSLLEKLVNDGRSTPGEKQDNDVPVDIWKVDTLPGVEEVILDDY